MGLALALSFLLCFCLHGLSSGSPYFTSLFTLGDSYIDAGNFVIMAPPAVPVWHDRPPYGMTFFGRPTGRLSDGRVTVDFIGKLNHLVRFIKGTICSQLDLMGSEYLDMHASYYFGV